MISAVSRLSLDSPTEAVLAILMREAAESSACNLQSIRTGNLFMARGEECRQGHPSAIGNFATTRSFNGWRLKMSRLPVGSEMAALEACAMIRRVDVRGGAIETRPPS